MNTRLMAAAVALAALVTGGLAGCSNAESSDDSSSSSASAAAGSNSLKGKKVVVLVSGSQKDEGFNQGTVEGFTKASKRLGFDLVVMDKVDTGNSQEAFKNAARQQPAMLVSGGAELFDGFSSVCEDKQYSKVMFMSVADFAPTCPGAVHFNADSFQAYYLTGVVAGLLLERDGGKKVGTVTGPELTFVTAQLGAMEEGLAAQDPGAKSAINYTGAFDDAGLAREASEAFIAQGVGVLTSYLSSGKVGAIAAAKESGTPILANSWDGCADPGDNKFAGSTVVNLGASINKLLDQYVAGTLKPGTLHIFGVDSEGIGANICDATAAEQKVLDDAKAKLISGEITIKSGGFTQQADGTAVPRS